MGVVTQFIQENGVLVMSQKIMYNGWKKIFHCFDESLQNTLHVGTDWSLNALRILSLFLVSCVSGGAGTCAYFPSSPDLNRS